MTRKRAGLVALFGVALLALAVEPAAAQIQDSTTESLIWGLNMNLLYVAIPITVLVEGILIYTVWRFRNQEEALPTQENRRLEVTWTIATAIILLFVGVASYQVMASPYVTAEAGDQAAQQAAETEHVVVEAQRYGWTFYYNGSSWDGEANVTTTTNLKLPANQDVSLRVTSTDWLHAFHVPGLGLKSDAFPGQYNRIRTNVDNTGTYQLYCAEYCGSGHSNMLGTVEVVPQDEYEDWLAEQRSGGDGSENSTESSGN
ncbi:cytochrome c oxidase subunit II [Haloarcula sp. S1AR25-5A]|uniref:cytochrome-c oxidase n=1 Tax=Haloarcula terrestris TaxID=2950533 RepID=A0AAE4EXW5_9EURY|nr:cytochrome c oxidase subunit II [Haloarcula terrestris]MDS0222221.1 cytochrome c oxidase subunit II [Haloarcula terrestris]